MGGNKSEMLTPDQRGETTLGEILTSAREKRGLSREAVVKETHIPAHYLRMLETDDYRLISDELYLLPFLRKYAGFLELDQEDVAMRLVREVQRVDNSPQTVRIDERPDISSRPTRRNWSKPAVFSGLVAVIIAAYIVQSRHNDVTDSSLSAPVRPPAHALPNSANFVANAAATARSNVAVPAETAPTDHSPNRAEVVPVAAPALSHLKSPAPRQTANQLNR